MTSLYLPCDRCGEMPWDPIKKVALPVVPTPTGLLCGVCNPNDIAVKVIPERPVSTYKPGLIWKRPRVQLRPQMRRAA